MAPSFRSHRQDSPMLWLSLVGGSLALHLIAVLLGRWYFAQPQKAASSRAPIAIDFVEVNPNATAPKAPKSVTPSNTAPKTQLPKATAPANSLTAQPSISALPNSDETVQNPRTASPTPAPRVAQNPAPKASPSPKPSQTDRAGSTGAANPNPSDRPAPPATPNPVPSSPSNRPENPTPSNTDRNPGDRPTTPATPNPVPSSPSSGDRPENPSTPTPGTNSPSDGNLDPTRPGAPGGSSTTQPGAPTTSPTDKPATSNNPLPTGGLFTAQVSTFKRSSETQNDSLSATLLSASTFQKKIDLVSGLGSQKKFDLDVQIEVQHDTNTSAKKSSTDRVRGTVNSFKVLPDSPALQQVDSAEREKLRVNLEDTLNQILSESPIEVEVTVRTNSNGEFAPASIWVTRIILSR